jgi:hypothetical protein
MELKPNEDYDGNQEWFDEYYSRIKIKRDYKHIPKDVFEQWIHPHHKKDETLINYSWMNFKNIEFIACEWSFEELSQLYVLEDYRDYFISRSKLSDFEQFFCIDDDLNSWKEKGTWRVPPVILDVNSLLSNIPSDCELVPPFQLVEGHSRLGYLHSMNRISELKKGKISSKHCIYLMREKNMGT